MRKQLLKTATAIVMGVGVFTGARIASASDGVVFIHGTGDSPGTVAWSGNNGTVAAAYGSSGYWYPGEVSAIAGSRPYLVVGFNGGSCAPWPQSGDSLYNKTSTSSSCPLPSNEGNGDTIVDQVMQFVNHSGITSLVFVTHSGGSNQARYIMDNPSRTSPVGGNAYSKVTSITRRVITMAGPTYGTYLANEVFGGGIGGYITGALAGWVGYGGEGVNFIRTNYMSTYNTSAWLGAPCRSGTCSAGTAGAGAVGGVPFYSGNGRDSTVSCVGVKVFGVCVGISNVRTLDNGASTPLSACDSVLDDTALLALNDIFLDANDLSTARTSTGANGASDGFISVDSAQGLGNVFVSVNADHNESRRQCYSIDSAVAKEVAGGGSTGLSAFSLANIDGSYAVNPKQIDACGFGIYAKITNSKGSTVAWTEGCTTAMLGNGNCDWDCVAMYGNDAVVTQWDSTGTKPLAWGASDCTATVNTYNGVTYTDTSTNPFDENQTYTNANGTYWTQFNGYTCTGTAAQCGGYAPSSYQWFYDPNYGSSTLSVGVCPQSWIGDGTCDECVLALYGSDGMDCAPGRIVQCGGIVTASEPYNGSSYYYYNNAIYNEGTPSTGGSTWLEWQSMSAVANDGVCENTECTQGTAAAVPMVATTTAAGTPCTSSAQCPGMLNCNYSTGYCYACTNSTNNAAYSCNSSTYGWSGGTCNPSSGICFETATLTAACGSNADCLSGSCVNGGCTTQATDCTTTYAVQPLACSTNSDCTGNVCYAATGTCSITGETCTSNASCSIPSGATSTCNASGQCSCTTSADCSGGAACTNSVCASNVTTSLCR